MKKILLTLALAAFAFTANAQWVIGGTMSAYHNNDHLNDYAGGTSTTEITLLPKVGYQLNNDMQIGLQFGWTFNYERNYAGASDNYGSTSNPALPTPNYDNWENPTIVIAPYLRYNFAMWKSFTIFAEAHLNVGIHMESSNFNKTTGNSTDNGDSFTSFGINIIPGLNYSLTDKISLDLYVNLLSCYANFVTAENFGGHSWGIGADMDAQTLWNHLGNFSLGFNYHF